MTKDFRLKDFHIKSPLVYSPLLSRQAGGHNVYLKLDNLQPSGSFKIRGIGASVRAAFDKRGPDLHVVSSSGGNAGLAAATAARLAGVNRTVHCPESTSDHTVTLLQAEGATVIRKGVAWDEANALAEETVDKDPKAAVLVHPFCGDDLVKGNATLVDEIYDQLAQEHDVASGPDLIACVTGGGGMISGVLQGLLNRQDQRRPTLVTVQCFGADAFSQSYQKGTLVTLPAITSKATSMGAKTCSPFALKLAQSYGQEHVRTVVMDDKLAASAACRFADDHRLIVELSCGAGVAIAYSWDRVGSALLSGLQGGDGEKKNIVIVVCGGSKDRLDDLREVCGETGGAVDHRIEVDGRTV